MEITRGERRNIEEREGWSRNHRLLVHLGQRSRYRCQSNQWFINRRANYGDTENKKRERGRDAGEGERRAGRNTHGWKMQERDAGREAEGMVSRRIGENGGCERKEIETEADICGGKERNGERSSVCLDGGP